MHRSRRHFSVLRFALVAALAGVAACASPVGAGSGSDGGAGESSRGTGGAEGGADGAETRHEYRRVVFGCDARIVIDAEREAAARGAAAAAFDRLDALDAIFSDYRVDSEVARLARAAGGPPVAVSDELFEVLELAGELFRRSGRAFDVTLGPVTRELRAARDEDRPVDPEVLEERWALVGFERLEIRRDERTVRLPEAGMSFDFGGIAKGYAADRALERLVELGFDAALVDLGGDIAAGSAPTRRPGWKVATEDLGVTLFLVRESVATTGAAATPSGRAIEGRGSGDVSRAAAWPHLFDPRSGRVVEVRRPVTVVAPRCALADALATIVALVGRERGAQIVGGFRGARILPDPPRSDKGRRLYDGGAVRQLRFVRRCRGLGLSLAEAEQLLSLARMRPQQPDPERPAPEAREPDSGAPAPCAEVAGLARAQLAALAARRAEIDRMMAALATLTENCGAGRQDCPALDRLLRD